MHVPFLILTVSVSYWTCTQIVIMEGATQAAKFFRSKLLWATLHTVSTYSNFGNFSVKFPATSCIASPPSLCCKKSLQIWHTLHKVPQGHSSLSLNDRATVNMATLHQEFITVLLYTLDCTCYCSWQILYLLPKGFHGNSPQYFNLCSSWHKLVLQYQ